MRRYWAPLFVAMFVLLRLFAPSAPALRVDNVRLMPAPETSDGVLSTVVNFALSNQGHANLTDIVVSVSIWEKDRQRSIGPYTLVGKAFILRAGQTVDFELELRNLAADCQCTARIDVLSAHAAGRAESQAPDVRDASEEQVTPVFTL